MKFIFFSKHERLLALSLVFTQLMIYSIYVFNHPNHTWDNIPYTALVLSLDKKWSDEIHKESYQTLKNVLNKENFHWLTSATEYRQQIFTDPEALRQQLPFYSIKPLYIFTTYLFYKAGFSVSDSLILVSLIPLVISGLLIAYWIMKYFPPRYIVVLTPVLLWLTGFIDVASAVRPDLLSAMLIILGSYYLLELNKRIATFILILAAICTRPDNLVFGILVILYLRFFARDPVRINNVQALFAAGALLATYFFISFFAGAYGWRVTFYSGFIEQLAYPESYEVSFDMIDYLRRLYWSISSAGEFGKNVILSIYSLIALFIVISGKHLELKAWAALCLMTIISHFLIFPSADMRFFLAYYFLVIMAALQNRQDSKTQLPLKYNYHG